MKYNKRHINLPAILFFLLIVFSLLLSACGGGNAPDNYEDADTYSISFNIVWQEASGKSRFKIDCLASGISTIEVHVYNEEKILLKTGGPWECDDREWVINDVPAGCNRILMTKGIDSNGDTI